MKKRNVRKAVIPAAGLDMILKVGEEMQTCHGESEKPRTATGQSTAAKTDDGVQPFG